jgi:aminocarboxycyclopropane-forming enzyme
MSTTRHAGLDHIAYATRDADATTRILAALGFEVAIHRQPVDRFGVAVTKTIAVDHADSVVELVEPRGPRSAVHALVQRHPCALYHACFRTDDLERTRARLLAAGAITISAPAPLEVAVTPAHRAFALAHMFHPDLGVFEITGPAPGT